jgi:zinc transporter 1/2/3
MFMVQGVMSAMSAGLLIYAATVEMLAGDFVFGDVEGGTHHHHHHEGDEHPPEHDHPHDHDHPHEHDDEDDDEEGVEPDHGPTVPSRSPKAAKRKAAAAIPAVLVEEARGDGEQRASPGKRVLAVLSLLAGVGMMVTIGLGE